MVSNWYKIGACALFGVASGFLSHLGFVQENMVGQAAFGLLMFLLAIGVVARTMTKSSDCCGGQCKK